MKLNELNEALASKTATDSGGDNCISIVTKTEEGAVLDVCADAFSNDPMFLWVAGLEKDDPDKKQKMYDLCWNLMAWANGPILHGKRGTVLGISPSDDHIAHVGYIALVPSSRSKYRIFDQIMSAFRYGLPPVYKRGEKGKFCPVSAKRLELLEKVEKARMKHMKGTPHWIYLQTIGVACDHHGKGYGAKLLRFLNSTADSMKVPVYLETESRQLEAMYKHFGFRTVEELTLRVPGDDRHDASHTMYLMRRN